MTDSLGASESPKTFWYSLVVVVVVVVASLEIF